jgi:hypothetical protein
MDNYFCAMLMGGNGVNGFAHFVDPILQWAQGLSPPRALKTF